jgi:hypothetical protein
MPVKAKAITPKMKTLIIDAATAVGLAAPDFSEGGGKTYEAWVLMELAKRASLRVNVSAQDHAGAPTTAFRVRGGPGYIPPADSAAPDQPCHFRLDGPRGQAELHSSLRHLGGSGDTHELDISAIDAAWAGLIRSHGGGPYPHHLFRAPVILGIELKEYDGAKSLPKIYPRALIGVVVDLEPHLHVAVAWRRGVNMIHYRGADFWLLTTTTLGSSRRLLDHHDIAWRENVEPGPHEDLLQAVADRLTQRLA